jgi:HAD superfamily hydrolase (TIGR01490 family)
VEAAFFDLDKTVIAKASMVAFGKPFYQRGLLSRRTLLRALWGQLVYLQIGASEETLTKMRDRALALTRGWEQTRISAIVRETLEEVVEPIIFSEAADLIDEHHDAGRKVFIVSASPEEIVAPLAQYLGADEAIASRARVDRHGRYTGEMQFYAYGPAKADAMRDVARRQGIDLDASYAYSDSATDVPMLEVVGHPVAVNPDRELARVAKERGWEVRQFIRPVRLRDRVPVPPSGPVATAGAAALGVAAGAAVWWWLRRRRALPMRPPSPPPTRVQAARTFLAATAPRAMRMASMRSFFMPGDASDGRAREPGGKPSRGGPGRRRP